MYRKGVDFLKNENKICSFTKENIIKDYEIIFKKNILSYFIKLIVFLLYYIFVAWIFSLAPILIIIDIVLAGTLLASGAYITWYYIKNIIELFKNRKAVLNGDFKVVTEKVVNVFSKERHKKFLIFGMLINPVLVFFIIEPKPHRLIFSGFGEYKVLDGQYYTFSDIYEMNDYGVFNRAAVGDTHYLVVCDKNIALAYNTKMFDYKENN